MSKLVNILSQPEGRRIEFKEQLPSNLDLAKTIISFANDAGGTLYLGIQDKPRLVVGIDEDSLTALEEKIGNIIHDQCAPTILPEIYFLNQDGKYIIVVEINKGSQPPYFLKNKVVESGTFIRVGSSNRKANNEIIDELKRKRNNTFYDSELFLSC
jgi:ATP-dependent DNA helicase RecG